MTSRRSAPLATKASLTTRVTARIATLGAFAILSACAAGPPADTDVTPDPVPRPRVATEPAPIPAGRAAEDPNDYATGVDVGHYEVEIALAESGTDIWGKTEIDVEVSDEANEEVTVDFTGLAIHAVEVDGSAVTWEHARGRLTIPAETGRHRISIEYSGTPDDGLILRDNVHGDWAVFADNWPNRARFWFPAVDHPSDKATVRFIVHAPAQWEVISNGLLESDPTRTPAGSLTSLGYLGSIDHRTWRYATRVDIPVATMVIGAADFAIHTVGDACESSPVAPGGCASVTSWSFPADSTGAAQIFRRAADMVDYFARLIGPFPYEKLANVQSSTRFGGMENSAAIFYSEAAIAQGTLSEGTVSHEIAHQWFGDSVTEFDWSHLWLSEGFATYFGALYFEATDGIEPFLDTMRRSRQRVVASQVVATRPVIEEDQPDLFQLLNDNNYPKGGWVLHMLRDLMGDDAFFRGIRQYYATYRDQTASTDDFREIMETAAGRDLETFFDQWLRHPGFPVLATTWDYDESADMVEVTVNQVQDANWPTYEARVTLEARLASGETVRHTATLDARTKVVRFAVPASVEDMVVDPDVRLLHQVR